MLVWRFDTLLRTMPLMLHVHTNGRECLCTRDGDVARCLSCQARLTILEPISQLPGLTKAIEQELPVTGVILMAPLSRDQRVLVASQETATGVAHVLPAGIDDQHYPLVLAA